MASGKELKRRIASIKSTQQITKAMKMVSAARLRRAQDAIVRARPFAAAIKQAVGNLSQSNEGKESHPLLARKEIKKVNIVIITSDRGLCGGFNSALLKKAEQIYRSESSKYEKLTFTCIGKKGFEYLNLRKIPVHNYLQGFQKGMSYAKAHALAEDIMSEFLSGAFDEVRVIFSEFRSAVSQVPTAVSLLPVDVSTEKSGSIYGDFLFEPSKEKILDTLLPRYFKAKVYKALLESAASEHGARMAAMDSATKNSGEMIQKLTLEFNKIRQAGITKELLEIVSGAEALK